MSSKFNINFVSELHPFRAALGELFPKICNDAKAFVGRLETENGGKNVVAKLSGVSVTGKCIIKSKEGYSLQMPLNNSMSILIRFGMELTKLDDSMGNRFEKDGQIVGGIESDIPEKCRDWVEQQRNESKSKAVVAAK